MKSTGHKAPYYSIFSRLDPTSVAGRNVKMMNALGLFIVVSYSLGS